MKKLLITIDGPAGAGKTTVSRALAQRLGYRYIDTGALYRAVAYEAQSRGIRPDDDAALGRLCRQLAIKFVPVGEQLRLFLNDVDISDRIRSPEISMLASRVSSRPVVRDYLLGLQRELGRQKGAVFEGRDMGTVVFPDADVKFYLKADSRARARRRYNELKDKSRQSLADVEKDMQRRDENDSTRQLAPLKPASDAVIIDSTDISVQEVVALMEAHIAGNARQHAQKTF